MVDGVGLGEDDLGEGDEGVVALEVGLKGQPCPYLGWALAPAVWGHEGRQVEDPSHPGSGGSSVTLHLNVQSRIGANVSK